MTNSTLQNYLLLIGLFWFCTIMDCSAQTPSVDLDSITEDSYRRMLKRQAAEKNDPVYPDFVAPTYNPDIESYTIDNLRSPRGQGFMCYVSDPKDFLPYTQEQRINKLLYALEHKYSVEVAVVMVPSIGQKVPKNFAVELFEKWGIGKSDKDNGLLILTVIDQHRTEFEVGYGLEGMLPDVVCYQIGVEEIVPRFKKGDFGGGVESAVFRIKEFLENPTAIDEVYGYGVVHEEESFDWKWYHFLLIVYGATCVIMGLWYYRQAFAVQLSKDDYYDK